MKFTDLEIQQFGKWRGLELKHLSDGLTVFYGPNEAGKTTLLQFVRGVLYGFAAGRRTKYLNSGDEGRGGGAIGVLGPQGSFRIERITGLRQPGDGDLAVASADGKPQGSRLLNVMLADVDEAVFNNVFAVGLRELQELGALSDTDAANALYSMTTGLDRVSLFEVLKQLEASRSRLLGGDENNSLIGRLQNRRHRIASEVAELSAARRRWIALREEHDHLGREIERIEQENAKLDGQASLIEAAITIRPSWLRREELDGRLIELGPKLELSDDATARFGKLHIKYEKHRAERQRLCSERRQLRKQASKFGVNETLRRYGPRIEAVSEQYEWVSALEEQIDSLKTETNDLQARWQAEKEKTGLDDDRNGPLIDAALLKTLRPVARAQRQTREKLVTAERQASECLEQADKLDNHLSQFLTGRKEKSLDQAIAGAGDRVGNLRKRLQLEERLDSLYTLRKDLEGRASLEGDDEMLPVGVLTGLGGMFVLGFVITVSALIWYRQLGDLSWIGALLGMAMIASTPLVKFFLQQSNVFASDDAQRRLNRLRDEVTEAEEERDELDRKLPTGGGALVSRLRQAEQELAELELLVPDETRQRSAMQDASAARDHVDQARKRHVAARKAWKKALHDLGLPANLSPKQVQDLAERNTAVSDALRVRNRRGDELDQRRREYEAVAGRVKQLMTDIGLTPEHDSLSGQIGQLLAIIRENERERGELGKLRREARELKREEIKHVRTMREVRRGRRELLNQAGCADADDFQRRVEHATERRELEQERIRLSEQIHTAIRNASASRSPIVGDDPPPSHSLACLSEWEETEEYRLLAELLTGDDRDRLDQLWEQLGDSS